MTAATATGAAAQHRPDGHGDDRADREHRGGADDHPASVSAVTGGR